VEVEEGEDEDAEQDAAVHAWSLEGVCCGQEKEDINWRSIGAVACVSVVRVILSRGTYRNMSKGTQLRRQNIVEN